MSAFWLRPFTFTAQATISTSAPNLLVMRPFLHQAEEITVSIIRNKSRTVWLLLLSEA